MSANSLGERVRWVADRRAASNGPSKLPYGLLSLWDMMNISVSQLGFVLDILKGYEREAKEEAFEASIAGKPWSPVVDAKYAELTELLKLCGSTFGCLESSHIEAACERIARSLKYKTQWSELHGQLSSLREIVEHELSRHYFYHYDREKALKVIGARDHWFPVISAFPHTWKDIQAGVDCWALGHSTASVFHFMRVLEHGLRALAVDVGKTFDIQQWHNIIDEIESEIRAIGKKLTRGMPKNERLRFLSEAAKEFVYFKDGWRNYVSHNRANYDEHQARSVMEHVHSFMTILASRLGEQGE